MGNFAEAKLGELITLQRGFDITKAEQTVGEVPIVSSSGISSYHNFAKQSAPGIVIGRKGTLGTVHFLNVPFWPHDTTLWAKDFKGNDPRFLYYFLKTLKLENFDTGSSNPTLNRNHVHKIKVRFPSSLSTQRKVAAILSSYDDLIENNKRRIALLEKMAEEIYREWFVRMRFPGYQNAKFVKGIPETWRVTSLSQIASFTMGQSPSSEFYNTIGEGLPFNQGVGTFGTRFPRREIFCNTSGRIASEGSILFSVRAPVGRINIADCKMIIGRGLAAVNHRNGHNSYLHYLLVVTFQNEDIIGNGSIFNSVGKDELARFKVYLPEPKVEIEFEKVVKPIDQQIELLTSSNNRYTSMRDLLLGRLMSGTVPVEILDVHFPPSMNENCP